MKIVIFGVGNYYNTRKKMIPESVEIVGFLDNNVSKKEIDGINVFLPAEIVNLEYDLVVLMSLNAYDMKQQLLAIGVDEHKVTYYVDFLKTVYKHQQIWYYRVSSDLKEKPDRVLIASLNLGYNGGAMSAIWAALALSERYTVEVAVTDGDTDLIEFLTQNGISVVVYPALCTINYAENRWLDKYILIIANTIKMISFAIGISNYKKVIAWLHDPYSMVVNEKKIFNLSLNQCNRNLTIVAVGDIAKRNFQRAFGIDYPIRILKYGVPDTVRVHKDHDHQKLIFALIGWPSPIKGQDILIEAVSKLTIEENKKLEIWLVGDLDNDSEYCIKLRTDVEKYDNIKIVGKLNREEMNKLYSEIDVVISPSREDILPIVLAEGMMQEKLCIASDATGTAKYITDGYDGLIFKSEDINGLVKKIRWVLDNVEKTKLMGKHARDLYLQEFSMERFTKDINFLIDEIL